MDDMQRAISLVKSGDKQRGGRLLTEILKKDPRNVNAWLWLSSCVSSNEQKIYCLKKVLEIDSNHSVALSALSKLQHLNQPTEQEILRHSVLSQTKVEKRPIDHNTERNRSYFQPKYLTACAGALVLIGTAFPWAAQIYSPGAFSLEPPTEIERYSGLTQAPGVITAIIGLAIIFISMFQQTRPGKPNSLISSLLAFITLSMVCSWPVLLNEVCLAGCYTTQLGTGVGYGLSVFSLLLAFLFGLIRNPKRNNRTHRLKNSRRTPR